MCLKFHRQIPHLQHRYDIGEGAGALDIANVQQLGWGGTGATSARWMHLTSTAFHWRAPVGLFFEQSSTILNFIDRPRTGNHRGRPAPSPTLRSASGRSE